MMLLSKITRHPIIYQIRHFIDFDPQVDYYSILGIHRNSNEKEIKASYYKLAQKYHPDKNGGKESSKFKDITNAYNILSDKKKKQQYDSLRMAEYGPEKRKYSSPFTSSSTNRAQQQSSYGNPYGPFYTKQNASSSYTSHNYADYDNLNEFFKKYGKSYTNTHGNNQYKWDASQFDENTFDSYMNFIQKLRAIQYQKIFTFAALFVIGIDILITQSKHTKTKPKNILLIPGVKSSSNQPTPAYPKIQ